MNTADTANCKGGIREHLGGIDHIPGIIILHSFVTEVYIGCLCHDGLDTGNYHEENNFCRCFEQML